jgi:hypothetical protein
VRTEQNNVFYIYIFVANLFRINGPMIRNSGSDRCGILFHARSGTPLSEWCRLHCHPILRMQFHPCPCIIGQFQCLKAIILCFTCHVVENNKITCLKLKKENY